MENPIILAPFRCARGVVVVQLSAVVLRRVSGISSFFWRPCRLAVLVRVSKIRI